MRILVVGSGGREHALSWKLAQEAEVICAPGNPGIAQDVECVPIPASDSAVLIDLCRKRQVELVVVGPEDPLVAGLADELRAAGLLVFGPGKDGAQLEGSKAFSKTMMEDAAVPTAAFQTFTHPEPAKLYASERFSEGRQVVVKASGNALGKGVVVCSTVLEAHDAIDMMMVDKVFGDAAHVVVIEDRLQGSEFSLLTLCSDGHYLSLPIAQDYKRALDADRGPNTGGMGAYSPVPGVGEELLKSTERAVVTPMLASLQSKGISYRGILFSGLMQDHSDLYCLEYNVRFGDPEAQSLMRRLGNGFAAALLACAKGEPIPPIELLDNAVVSVVLASGGYPGSYEKGLPIEIPADLDPRIKVFHAGTAMKDGELVTAGGRVLAVSAAAPTLEEAREAAYAAAARIQFNGKHFRKDIGQLPLAQAT